MTTGHGFTGRLLPVLAFIALPGLACGQGEWRELEPLPEATGELIAVTGAEPPTVLGGLRGDWQVEDSVWQYHGEDGWRELPAMPVPLNHHAAAAVDGTIYVMGGASDFAGGVTPRADVFAFDPQVGEWREVAPMPAPRFGHAAAAADGRIYVVGGMSAGDAHLFIFDPDSNEWERGPAMSAVRDHLALVPLEGRLFAIGGREDGENTSAVEVYDIATAAWTDASPLNVPRSGFAAAAVAGRIHVVGGEDLESGEVLSSHEVYDAASDNWSVAADMPQPSHGVAGFPLDGGFAVVGGSSQAGGRSLLGWLSEAWLFEPQETPATAGGDERPPY